MTEGNPYEVTEFEVDGEKRMYVPLDLLPEEAVEIMRKQKLTPNTPDADLGATAPGIKADTAEEQSRREFEEALNEPIDEERLAEKGDAKAPSDALG